MRTFVVYSIFLFILISHQKSYSQCLITDNDLEFRFLKEKIEVLPGKTFFNVISVSNKSSRNIDFELYYNVPKDWKLIGQTSEFFNIEANSSLSIPVRVVVANQVNGGVGYVIAASLRDEKGTLFRTEYSYLGIPVRSKVTVNAINKTSYFDNSNFEGELNIKIKNEGNTDEKIRILADPDKSLEIINENMQLYVKDINLAPARDTTIVIKAKLKSDEDYKKFILHKVNISVSAKDTIINKTMWFKYLNWEFENYIPETNNPLVVELIALNIFSQTNATYRGRIYGNLLLKNKKSVFYSAENWNRSADMNDLWVNSKLYVGYSSPKLYLYLGDYSGNFEQSMYGRGVYAIFHITKRQSFSAAATRRVLRPVNNYGASYKINFKKGFGTEIGGAYSLNMQYNSEYKTIFERTSFNLLKNNRFNILLGYGQSDYLVAGTNRTYDGYGYNFDYSGSIKSVKLNLKSYFGTPDYPGYSKGRLYISGFASTRIGQNKDLVIQLTKQKYQPSYFVDDNYYNDRFSDYEQIKANLGFYLENNIYLFTGLIFENQGANNYSTFSSDAAFKTFTTKGEIGIRLYEKYTSNTVTFTGRYGLVNIYEFTNILNGIFHPELNKPEPLPASEIILNVKRKKFGAYFIYYYGPNNLTQQFSQFYYSYFNRTLNIMPYYETFIYKKTVKFGTKATYINNLASSNSRLNVNSRIDLYAKRDWNFYFLNTMGFQTRRGTGLQGNNFYSSTYFEFGIKKVFGWNQPRLKYYDFDAVFYKDLNGNRAHDQNEPGVSNVLVNINRKDPVADAKNPNYNGEFMNVELLSNSDGRISYKNIVNGEYLVNFAQTSSYKDNFSAEESQREYKATGDTLIYIPFTEKNKIFGKVVIHKTKYSSLDDVPVDNLKIIVEGNGKLYETLTNKDGYFEMFLPVSDWYKVSIVNIYYENFDIRREYFMVKFNGYRQFEVTFDFDEKKREIKFDEQDFVVNEQDDFQIDEITVLRQTNLRGVVRDENSLNPLHASIILRNSKTNELITEAASSVRGGDYSATFFTGNSYILTAEAKGYWKYKESLEIDQITSFETITRDILLAKIVDGEKMNAENLNFAYGAADISQVGQAQLDIIYNKLSDNTDVKIQISGYTDNLEANNFDAKQLSLLRANAVSAYLKSKGLNAARISVTGEGEKNPAVSNDSESGRAKNRRVEIIIKYSSTGNSH